MKYKDIINELSQLSRQEGYRLLLETEEWYNTREIMLNRYDRKCWKCNIKEGYIEEPLSESEIKKNKEAYESGLGSFEEYLKLPLEVRIQMLLDGKIVGRPLPVIDVKIIGYTHLHVHHKLYIASKLPWEYPKYLEVLCADCHKAVHQTTTIYTYKDETLKERKELVPCTRCNGTGYLDEYHYRDEGICYECWGLSGHYDYDADWITIK